MGLGHGELVAERQLRVQRVYRAWVPRGAGGGSGPGVVVIQEWWGLTDHIADVADRLAAEGFVALAPDLYGGATTHDADEAGRADAGAAGGSGAPRTWPARWTTCWPTTR